MGSKNANPLTYLFVQDSKSTEALSFRGLEPARDESLTLHSFIRSEDRPFPIFLHIPLSEIRDLMLVQIEPHLFNLTHREVPNEQGYRVYDSFRGWPRPRGRDVIRRIYG